MKASKSPAFQFYPMDWLSDINVASMTIEQEGVYIRLLCYCWLQGSIPVNLDALTPLCKGASKETITSVLGRFHPHSSDPSKLIHKRLDRERKKKTQFSKIMSESGKAGNRKRWANHYVPMSSKT